MATDARVQTAAGLQQQANRDLVAAFGGGGEAVAAWAPGRCTLLGEHVDYAGGVVLCIAIDLGVAAAIRVAPDGIHRAFGAGHRAVRGDPAPAGDIGDRVFAAMTALRRIGVDIPPCEVALSASVPAAAGLASSAAVICAVIAAALRLARARMTAHEFVQAALTAERDIVGVPCGSLDQHAVVEAPPEGALLLDCREDSWTVVPWPWREVVLCACSTGETHDVGGTAYRSRREQTERALGRLHVTSAQDVTAEMVNRGHLSALEARRVRHAATESTRAEHGARAMRAGDVARLGELMSESHRSLRDDHEVSTPALDAAVDAAIQTRGCFGARMVGAGFGGTAIALVRRSSAARCAAAMAAAGGGGCSTWMLQRSAGLSHLAADVIGSR